MKTLYSVPLELVRLPDDAYMPNKEEMEFGKFYYSKTWQCSNHLCPCGCGLETYIPLKKGEWNISFEDDIFTITPSILHQLGCKLHYVIQKSVAKILP